MFDKEVSILIVEDEFIGFEYLKRTLHKLSLFNIFHAKSSEEALKIVESNYIDLCFMDINISGAVDGIICAKLINKKYFLPIIYTSAHADTQTIKEAKDTNVYGYLVKPFNIKEIEATMQIAFKVASIIDGSKKHKSLEEPNEIMILSEKYSYDRNKKTFFIDDTPCDLTKKELLFIDYVCAYPNTNLAYEHIKEAVWGISEVSLSTIRDTVYRIKHKLPDLPLHSISKHGYILKTQ